MQSFVKSKMSLEEFTYNNYKSIQDTTTISPELSLPVKLQYNYHFRVPPFPNADFPAMLLSAVFTSGHH